MGLILFFSGFKKNGGAHNGHTHGFVYG